MGSIIILLIMGASLTILGNAKMICPSRTDPEVVFMQNRDRMLFYVDNSNGDDTWDGTISSPFQTIEAAILRMRKQKLFSPKTLFVRQGTYHVKKTINLLIRDSNLSIVGYPEDDERPIISGGYKIPGSEFSHYDTQIYVAPFYGKCSKHVFLGEKRLVRARKPSMNKWKGNEIAGQGPYLYIENLLDPSPDSCTIESKGRFKQSKCSDENKRGFAFKHGDIKPSWNDFTTGEILFFESWTAKRAQINEIQDNRVYFKYNQTFPIGMHAISSGRRYIVENIFEELDAAGEYFCDEERHKLYLIPPKGALEFEDVFVGSTETFFNVKYAKDIRFSDLEFRYTHDGNFGGYNQRKSSLSFFDSDNIEINRCIFSHLGHTGIFMRGCNNAVISENKFYDIGYVAVSTDYKNNVKQEFQNQNILIKKNTFEGCGVTKLLQPSCVHVKGAGNINVTDNEISRIPYAGIKVGWQQTFKTDDVPSGKFIFHIERNHVYNYGLGILNDFGGIYLSSNPGCGKRDSDLTKCHLHAYVANNVIHHSRSYHHGAMGVYGDTAVSSLTVEENWLYNLDHTAVNFHCGQNNFALNNMIYHTPTSRVFGTCNNVVGEGKQKQILTFKRNVIFVNNSKSRLYRLSDIWANDVPKVDNNVYYFNIYDETQSKEFFPIRRSFNEWQNETKNDLNSQITDPKFISVHKSDYRLAEKSIAFDLGIKSVDLRHTRRNSGIC